MPAEEGGRTTRKQREGGGMGEEREGERERGRREVHNTVFTNLLCS